MVGNIAYTQRTRAKDGHKTSHAEKEAANLITLYNSRQPILKALEVGGAKDLPSRLLEPFRAWADHMAISNVPASPPPSP